MRRLLFAVVCFFTMLATPAMAQLTDARVCQSQYASAVSTCATGLNFLEPNMRAGAQKACVQNVQTQRNLCLNGGSPQSCPLACQTTYTNTIAYCEATYNPDDPNICTPGDAICVIVTTNNRSNCVVQATEALNTCNASCPP